ncbi:3-oxoacyl-[acyl-carrier-protein] synthase III C-terminal domain-containing protein, partial [Neisseria sp. P0013.S007]
PSRLVPSTEIDALLGIKEGRTEKLSGLAQRYFLADDESADAMQLQAAKNALAAAGITIDDVDCVINASGIDRQCIPFN